MNTVKVVVGAILLIAAVYVFMAMTDFTVQYVGGGILAVIGLVLLILGLRSKKAATVQAQPPAPVQNK